jgi:hypothetical protein
LRSLREGTGRLTCLGLLICQTLLTVILSPGVRLKNGVGDGLINGLSCSRSGSLLGLSVSDKRFQLVREVVHVRHRINGGA